MKMDMNKPKQIHIKAKYVEYTEVIEVFTEEKIEDRYYRLFKSAIFMSEANRKK